MRRKLSIIRRRLESYAYGGVKYRLAKILIASSWSKHGHVFQWALKDGSCPVCSGNCRLPPKLERRSANTVLIILPFSD